MLETDLRAFVIPEIQQAIFSDEHIEQVYEATAELMAKATRSQPKSVSAARRKVDSLRQDLSDMMATLHRLPEDIQREYIDRITETRGKLALAVRHHDELERASGASRDLPIDQARQLADHLRRRRDWLESRDEDLVRQVLVEFVEHITVVFEHHAGAQRTHSRVAEAIVEQRPYGLANYRQR